MKPQPAVQRCIDFESQRRGVHRTVKVQRAPTNNKQTKLTKLTNILIRVKLEESITLAVSNLMTDFNFPISKWWLDLLSSLLNERTIFPYYLGEKR